MNILDFLNPKSIKLNVAPPKSKEAAIDILVDLMADGGHLKDKAAYKAAILTREAQGSTGLADGIATPHAKSAGVTSPGLAAMTVPAGMDFQALDDKPSRLFFMIAAPEGANDTHLEVLSQLATMLMDPAFKDQLLASKSVEEFLAVIKAKEEPDTASETPAAPAADGYQILAVTACPTGIAHTYMAAESLEQHAKARNITIKVETNGTSGRKNVLTDDEIAKADCIIVAADKDVPMARFNGKKVIITKVANGINKADELLDRAVAGQAPVYRSKGDGEESFGGSIEGESFGRQVYKHLMNGVSHMLPFVVGGGLLIAIAFLVDTYNPASPATFGSNTPLAKFFMTVGGTSFGFMLPVLAGYIGMSIADRPGLVAGFIGGALANTGGAGFLGALVAGFVAGYLVNGIKKALTVLPSALDGIKNILLYPLIGILLIGAAMIFIINPPLATINTWMVATLKGLDPNSRMLIGAIMGGMMAIDMGGPFNKAAYVTATGLLASGEYGIMAAVMAGGMVPPLVTALSTTFFPNRYTSAERKSGLTNYIMGISFITEGAIPFAAADPIRVIPACVVGSAIAGSLSMFFDCTLRAPHGGIYVIATIGNPLYYLLAIAIGSVVGMLILSFLKKPLKNNQ